MSDSNSIIESKLSENRRKESKGTSSKHSKMAEDLIQSVRQFESDSIELAKSSAKRAWIAAGTLLGLSVLLGLAIIILTPLKEVDYRLLSIDTATGHIDELRPLENSNNVSYGETMDRFFISKFIDAYEGYNWFTVQDSYDFIKLSSNDAVFSQYSNYIRSNSSPVEVLSENNKVDISDVSISFIPTNQDNILAHVSFTKTVLDVDDSLSRDFKPTKWKAVMSFDYLADISKESERLLNPLAFRVTSFEKDRVIE